MCHYSVIVEKINLDCLFLSNIIKFGRPILYKGIVEMF